MPPACTPFVVTECGNCSPRWARLSMHRVAETQNLQKNTNLPLTLATEPLATPLESELPVDRCDARERGPPRCDKCKAYVNNFVAWREHGDAWLCDGQHPDRKRLRDST